jgi:ATP-binding cassette subfamily B protein
MAITGTGTGRHRAEDTMILRQVPPQAPDETMILRLPLK